MRRSVLIAVLAATAVLGGTGPASAQGFGADCPPVAVGTQERAVRLETERLAVRRGAVFGLRIAMNGTDFNAAELHYLRIGPSVLGGGVFDPSMGVSPSGKDPAIRFVVDESLFAELVEAGTVELFGTDGVRLSVALAPSGLIQARDCIARHSVPLLQAADVFRWDPRSVLRLFPDQAPRFRSGNVRLDYPPVALAEGRQGTTVTRITIGTSGRVRGCEIARSSGSHDLDAAACAGVGAWLYHPATDGDAVPIEATVSQPVAWELAARCRQSLHSSKGRARQGKAER